MAVAPGLCEFFGPSPEASSEPENKPALALWSLWPAVIIHAAADIALQFGIVQGLYGF